MYKVIHLTLNREMTADILRHLTAVIVSRQSRLTALAVISVTIGLFSLLTITLTCRDLDDHDGSRDTREVGAMSAVNIGTCVAALTV